MDKNIVQTLVLLYELVLDRELKNLEKSEIIQAINIIQKTYKRIDSNFLIPIVNYNYNIYRFAYIYLYAVCHTAVVREHMKILEANASGAFREMFKLEEKRLNICSLGGGPGCEVIGILSFLGWIRQRYPRQRQNIDCTILDLCLGWRQSFAYVLDTFLLNSLWKSNSSKIYYRFFDADLCSDLGNNSKSVIQNADVVTMVKFVSIVSYFYRRNPNYLKNIFQLMKSNSYLFFLDNCIGGFYEMVSDLAEKNNFVLVICHKTHYKIDQSLKFSKYKFNRYPFRSTSVIFAIWKKKEIGRCPCICL